MKKNSWSDFLDAEKPRLTAFRKVLIAVVLVAAAVCVHIFVLPRLGLGADREMNIMPTGRGFSYDFDSGASFHSNDSRFFYFATRDSVRRINSNEALEWQVPVNFNNPWMSSRGDFVAVGEERGGLNVYVFDENGLLFPVNKEHSILSFWVNETGFLSVITRYENGGYGIYVFNEHRRTAPLFHWDIFYDLVTPTHVEVSPDGRYVVVALMDLTFSPRSSVQFRYMNQRDAWGTEQGLFATQDFPGEAVTALRFMGDNRLLVATTARIVCFQLGPGHTVSHELWSIELENAKDQIAFHGTHFAFAAGDRLIGTEDGDPLGTVRVYNISGNQTGRFELGRRVTHLHMGHNAVIIGGERSFHAMDLRGNPLWEYTALFDTRDLIFLDNTNVILAAGQARAEIFERRRVREEDFSIDPDQTPRGAGFVDPEQIPQTTVEVEPEEIPQAPVEIEPEETNDEELLP